MNDNNTLNILTTEDKVTTLGPGSRFVVWTVGCHRNCPGCITAYSHDSNHGEKVDVGTLAWDIVLSDCEGITISGGEPFLQARSLAEMVRRVKHKADKGVIIYTGYLIEELENVDGAKELLELCDLVIDGPYLQELDDNLSLRGSSNQRVIPLTERYKNCLYLYGSEKRESQTFIRNDHISTVGIPSHDTNNTAN